MISTYGVKTDLKNELFKREQIWEKIRKEKIRGEKFEAFLKCVYMYKQIHRRKIKTVKYKTDKIKNRKIIVEIERSRDR